MSMDGLLDVLPVGIAMVDRSGRQVWANAAARAMGAIEAPALERAVAQVLATGEKRREKRLEGRASTAAAPGRWLDVTIAPVEDVDGEVVAALLTIVDVTGCTSRPERWPISETCGRM